MADPGPQGPPPGMQPLQPGQQPSPEQIRFMQQQLMTEAQKRGISVQQYVEELKAQAMQQHQHQQQHQQQQQQQAQQGQQQQQEIQGGQPPKPEAIALANFLRAQDLKTRTCIFQEKRKDMFKVKRAIRALYSPAYTKARAKNPLLPEVGDRASAENIFKQLPISMLALRIHKVDPHAGHNHGKKKRVKGLWTVEIERQQDAADEMHYVWLYEGSQWKQKLYAGGALFAILAVVFFPVWPYKLRLGVWYVSMACLGVLALFFAMAILRLIIYVITRLSLRRGWWLYPNLFEDVGFFDSFRPLWAWDETAEDKAAANAAKKAKRRARKLKAKASDEQAWESDGDEDDEVAGDEDDEEHEASGDDLEADDANTTVAAEGSPSDGDTPAKASGSQVKGTPSRKRNPQKPSVEDTVDP